MIKCSGIYIYTPTNSINIFDSYNKSIQYKILIDSVNLKNFFRFKFYLCFILL